MRLSIYRRKTDRKRVGLFIVKTPKRWSVYKAYRYQPWPSLRPGKLEYEQQTSFATAEEAAGYVYRWRNRP